MKKNILTKEKIENLALKIFEVLHELELDDALCIYYNNKRLSTYNGRKEIVEGINPHDYFQYCAFNHILSISTEGGLYNVLNYGTGRFPKKLENIFKELGIYWELGNAWNLSFYPIDDDMKVEYTYYKDPTEKEIFLHYGEIGKAPSEIQNIMEAWYELSRQKGDIGACVLGASMKFKYKDKEYKMMPCSPWQGEGSWLPYIEFVKESLKNIGASEIKWNCGVMD